MPDNTPATLALLDSLLREGVWAAETICFRDGSLAAIELRRLRKDEKPGQPPTTHRNERGMVVTTYFPREEQL